MARLLAAYDNGNTRVALFSDGTKVRSWPDGEEATPVWPESIDLKITDWCDAGCPWCHESSTLRGEHADLSPVRMAKIFGGAPAGIEVAIGGGHPLAHPGLDELLYILRDRGYVANLTVNVRHLVDPDVQVRIVKLVQYGLIHGIGISYSSAHARTALDFVNSHPNAVLHLIAGIDSPEILGRVQKALVLGYKVFGRGALLASPGITLRIARWEEWFSADRLKKMRTDSHIVSFDNLAIQQLRIQEKLDPETWSRNYLGDDGSHTFYLDLVTDRFATSSTSPRRPREGRGLREMLATVRSAE